MVRERWIWPGAIIVLSLTALVAICAGWPLLIRGPVVGAFLLLCPGLSLIRIVRITDPVAEVAIGMSISLSLDTMVSLVMLYSGHWSWRPAMLGLVILSVFGAIVQIFRATKRGQEEPA